MTLDKQTLQVVAKIKYKTLLIANLEQLLINTGYSRIGSVLVVNLSAIYVSL
jgi:hypothetical protein